MFKLNVSRFNNKYNFEVTGPASLDKPKNNALMFITKKYLCNVDQLRKCMNCLVLVPEGSCIDDEIHSRHCIVYVDNPRLEYAKLMNELAVIEDHKLEFNNGYYIGENTILGKNVYIEPFCIIGDNVRIDDNTRIMGGVKIYDDVTIGKNCIIYDKSIIGIEGFGFEKDENGNNVRIPHVGGVIIEDDVEIGTLSVIAKGAIDPTIIGRNTKVDCLAYIAHNDEIGERCIITGGSIVCGSVKISENSYLGPNCTIMNKVSIGENALIGLGADVFISVKENRTVSGMPAKVIQKND